MQLAKVYQLHIPTMCGGSVSNLVIHLTFMSVLHACMPNCTSHKMTLYICICIINNTIIYILQFQNTAEKLADITSSVISAVNPRCRCSLTEDQISTEHFLCTSDERVVLYRAELSGRPDCAQVLSYIQQWVNGSQTSILVQGNSLVVYPNCPITVQSLTAQANCVRSTTPGPDSGSIGIIAAGGGVGGVLFIGIVVLAAVVICMCIYKRRRQR